jgi:hypothetical protein
VCRTLAGGLVNADEPTGYGLGWDDAMTLVRTEILDLCDAIDQDLVEYGDIATKLRAIVGEES